MAKYPGFIFGSYNPVSYRADVEKSLNLYCEVIESQNGPNKGFLRRRPALKPFAGLTGGGTTTSSIDYDMVGGGGGYGSGLTEGGGGGGWRVTGSVTLTVGTYPVVIGLGGATEVAGTDTTFNGFTAQGGGVGGNDADPGTGGDGGNGGGAATSYFDGSNWTPFSGGVGTPGYNGGNSAVNAGAGGAGAGGPGQTSTQNNGGAGGPGVTSSIFSSPLVLGAGGAGVGLTTRGTFTAGDYGCGGTGSELDPGHSPIGNQVEAQDGVVIIRYLTANYTATGGTVTSSGDYTYHLFETDDDFVVTQVIQTVIDPANGGAIHEVPAYGRGFVISNAGAFFEFFADGSLNLLGTVAMGSFRPCMADNGVFHQLLIVSGETVYVFDLNTNVLTPVTSDQIDRPVICVYSDSYFILMNVFGVVQWSSPGDGTTWDALDVAQRSTMPDPWVSILVNHRELWLIGSESGEIWTNTGNVDQPFELVQGSVFHQGVIAPFTLQRCDNSSFWVGQNDQGRCIVFRANGYTPQRISTHPVEVALGSSANLEGAIATVFQSQGHTFYQIYVADLPTSWVYDCSTELWAEWSEETGGVVTDPDTWTHAPWPVLEGVFIFGKNLVVGPSTVLIAELSFDDELIADTIIPPGSIAFSGGGNSRVLWTSPSGDIYPRPTTQMKIGQPIPDASGCTGFDTFTDGSYCGVDATTPDIMGQTFTSGGSVISNTAGAPFGGELAASDGLGNMYGVTATLVGFIRTFTVKRFTSDGTITGSWDVWVTDDTTDAHQLTHLTVNQEGTIAYFHERTVFFAGGYLGEIHAWDIQSDSDLGLFASETECLIPSFQYQALLCLQDGRVLAEWDQWSSPFTQQFARLYNPDGTTSKTYDLLALFGQIGWNFGWAMDTTVSPSVPVSSSFWVVTPTYDPVTVAEVDTEAGTIIRSFVAPVTPGDDGSDFLWGEPFCLSRVEITSLVEPPIRWLRRTPHAVNELKRVYYSRLELLMDVATSKTTDDPAIYMRYSDNGGRSYSGTKTARYGEAGAFGKRVYWTPLGAGRDRVFEVFGESMAPLRIVDAYIEFKPGVN